MTAQFRPNPNATSQINEAIQKTLERMKGSDFSITDSLHFVFACDGKVVLGRFVHEGQEMGEKFSFTLSEAADLGQRIMEGGSWDKFPVSGISVDRVKALGQRLR